MKICVGKASRSRDVIYPKTPYKCVCSFPQDRIVILLVISEDIWRQQCFMDASSETCHLILFFFHHSRWIIYLFRFQFSWMKTLLFPNFKFVSLETFFIKKTGICLLRMFRIWMLFTVCKVITVMILWHDFYIFHFIIVILPIKLHTFFKLYR